MLKVKYPIIVEGKYDKAKLASLVQAEIIVTNGFGIFKNKEKVKYLQDIAKTSKLILLTDSDRAGFKIRGYLNGCIPPEQIVHIYIPEIFGKEKRKDTPSAEGTLGVEGIPADILRKAFTDACVICESDQIERTSEVITKQQLFTLGLSGGLNSSQLRDLIKKEYNLPKGLSTSGLSIALSRITDITELTERVEKIKTTHL